MVGSIRHQAIRRLLDKLVVEPVGVVRAHGLELLAPIVGDAMFIAVMGCSPGLERTTVMEKLCAKPSDERQEARQSWPEYAPQLMFQESTEHAPSEPNAAFMCQMSPTLLSPWPSNKVSLP